MRNRVHYFIVVLFVVLSLLWASMAVAQAKPSLPALTPLQDQSERETSYKNVRLLKHLSEMELVRVMAYITESLGVKCVFCHNEQNFALDENPRKKRAREMIVMVQYLNQKFFKEARITCYTCHAGSTAPAYLPEGFQALPSLMSAGKPRKLPTDFFKNVQKLFHLTEKEYDVVMDSFVAGLGARNCFTCHNRRDYSSDELPQKVRAREMISLVQDINKKFFTDERLTCYSCHQGNLLPKQIKEDWIPGWK